MVVRDPRLPPPARSTRRCSEQLERMAHVMFGGLTHEPAIAARGAAGRADAGGARARVLRRLRLGQRRGRDQDGAAVLARRGRPEKRGCSTLRGGYHGDTFGAMAVCDPVGGMHRLFAGVAARSTSSRRGRRAASTRTSTRRGPPSVEALFERHADELAGGDRRAGRAGRGRHALLLARVRARCCASCATRTACCWSSTRSRPASGAPGALFACEHAGVAPDIMCVGKALTGGYMTLAATLCTRAVAAASRRARRAR